MVDLFLDASFSAFRFFLKKRKRASFQHENEGAVQNGAFENKKTSRVRLKIKKTSKVRACDVIED